MTQGATTIWERWDGIKPDGTFQDVGMNSFNHYAYGAVGDWLYKEVAGLNIDPLQPGYKHIIFHPIPGGGLTFATAKLMTMYGQVLSAWKIESDTMSYHVIIPANSTATVWLPGALMDQVKASLPNNNEHKKQGMPPVFKFVQQTKSVTVNIGSGDYIFKYPFRSTL